MQSYVTLEYRNKILIIDAKYYAHITQKRYDVHTLRSMHMYQIFAYVKNKQEELPLKPGNVSGMLLYAKTDEEIQPNNSYQMSGNTISVRNLDLNKDFENIKKELNNIVEKTFGA